MRACYCHCYLHWAAMSGVHVFSEFSFKYMIGLSAGGSIATHLPAGDVIFQVFIFLETLLVSLVMTIK